MCGSDLGLYRESGSVKKKEFSKKEFRWNREEQDEGWVNEWKHMVCTNQEQVAENQERAHVTKKEGCGMDVLSLASKGQETSRGDQRQFKYKLL